LSPTPSTSSATNTAENTDKDPYDPEPSDGDIQTEHFPDYWYSPCIGAVRKNYLLEIRSVQVPPDNPVNSVIWQVSGPMQVGLTEFCSKTAESQTHWFLFRNKFTMENSLDI
jgi:hypothetical protein